MPQPRNDPSLDDLHANFDFRFISSRQLLFVLRVQPFTSISSIPFIRIEARNTRSSLVVPTGARIASFTMMPPAL